jgi:D-amino-acid dehydrogenase
MNQADSQRRILVIGAGIVGICCGLYLQRAGFAVTILDRDGPGETTSFGSAGNLGGNAHFAIPNIVRKLPGMLLNRNHPMALLWRDAPTLARWLRLYIPGAESRRVAEISAAMAALNAGIFDTYDDLLADSGETAMVQKRGRLFVWSTEEGYQRDQYGLAFRRRVGIELNDLTGAQAREMEPALGGIVQRAVFAPNAGHIINPHRFVNVLARLFTAKGGVIGKETVRGVTFTADDAPVVITEADRHQPDQVVIAAGFWSRDLASQLGDHFPLVAERGYHAMMPRPGVTMRIPTLWEERKVIFTPMEHGLRASGIAEFVAREAAPRYRYADRVKRTAMALLPGLNDADSTQWMGMRPVLPDYLPVIGRSTRHPRVIYAFGHGHSGYNTGPATGRLVGNIASGRAPNVDIAAYRADRFRGG